MAILDALLTFTGGSTGIGNSDGKTDSPTTGTQVASNILDVGIDSGVPTSANGGGARDIGQGGPPNLKLIAQVTTLFASGTSIQVILAGAPDDGAGAPGSYVTMFTGPVVVEANLIVGAQLANNSVPMVVPGQPLPRYLRMSFVTDGTHTAGAVYGGILLNYIEMPGSQTGILSGYPAGITVAN